MDRKPFFGQSVYERYRSKIDGNDDGNNNLEDKNNNKKSGQVLKENRESALNKVRRLSQEIDKDIAELRVSR